MRVLHVIPTYLPAVRYGGPMFAVHALCKHLARLGHEMHVYTTNLDGDGVVDVAPGSTIDRDGVQVSYFAADRSRRFAVSSGMASALAQHLRSFDVVHTHSVFLWPPWRAARSARLAAVPYVMAPHGMLVGELLRLRKRLPKTVWLRLLERRNLAGADALHFTSELERDEARRLGIPVRRAAVIPYGVDPDEPAGDTPDDAGAIDAPPAGPFVLHLGRVSWKKGLDRLVRALASKPELRAVIAGNDEEDCRVALQRLAQACGVAERVRFLGPLYGAAKWKLLRAAKIFVLPSHSENFAVAVLEAMAVGVPVVISPAVGLAEAVRSSGCGMVVDPARPEFADALHRLWRDDALCAAMGERGRALALREYSWPRTARQVAELYTSVVDARHAAERPRA